jgi:hypothetical protein
METVRETQSRQTTQSKPTIQSRPTNQTRPTAKSRPTFGSAHRQPTSNTLADHGLAGPHAYDQDQRKHDTYYEDGYEDANPWMQDQTDKADFSLAGNFPRTVRWGNKRRGTDKYDKHEHVQADSKGETEEAPQTASAENQGEGNDHDPVDDASSVGEEESIKRQKREGGGDLHRQETAYTQNTAEYPQGVRPHNWWAKFRTKYQYPLAEFLGMVVFMFLGTSANLVVYVSESSSGSQQTVWWTWGFAVMIVSISTNYYNNRNKRLTKTSRESTSPVALPAPSSTQ